MQKVERRKNTWKTAAPYIKAGALMTVLSYGITQIWGSAAEKGRLADLRHMAVDTTVFSLESANAVSLAVYSTAKDLKEGRRGERFTLDLDDRNLILGNKPRDADTNLVPFDEFGNQAIIDRAVKTGCLIARAILDYPDTSLYREERRAEIKEMAQGYAATYCPSPAPTPAGR